MDDAPRQPAPAVEAELVPAAAGAHADVRRTAAAVARRLRDNTLTPEDEADVARARTYRDMKRRGCSDLEIARELGWRRQKVESFVKGKIGQICLDHLESRAVAKKDSEVDRIVSQSRRDFASLTPDSVEFLRYCFRRKKSAGVKKGEEPYEDAGLAQFATQIVAKGAGLTEPSTAVKPTVIINVGSIKIEQRQVGEDDELAAAAARDITPGAEARP